MIRLLLVLPPPPSTDLLHTKMLLRLVNSGKPRRYPRDQIPGLARDVTS